MVSAKSCFLHMLSTTSANKSSNTEDWPIIGKLSSGEMPTQWTHCLLQFGFLLIRSLFSTESCLNHIGRLSHGSVSLGQQIAYWWCIYRQLNSRKTLYRSTLFTREELILDSFFDPSILHSHRQEFELLYNQTFGEFPSQSMKMYSRYTHGLLTYHSMSHSRRNESTSFNVCIEAINSPGKSTNRFGQILFTFMYKVSRSFYSENISHQRIVFLRFCEDHRKLPSGIRIWTDTIRLSVAPGLI